MIHDSYNLEFWSSFSSLSHTTTNSARCQATSNPPSDPHSSWPMACPASAQIHLKWGHQSQVTCPLERKMAWNKHLKTQVNNEIQEGVSINSPDADCMDNDPSKSWFRRSPGLPKRGGGESTNWKWKNLCSASEVKLLDHSCTQWNILRNSIGLLMHVSYCVWKIYIYIVYVSRLYHIFPLQVVDFVFCLSLRLRLHDMRVDCPCYK